MNAPAIASRAHPTTGERQPGGLHADGRPADMTESHDLNNGKPWSAIELDDLEHGLRIGVSIQVIADFIMRDAEEVRQKATELGIFPKRKLLSEEAFN
jgi:hypothetical protein